MSQNGAETPDIQDNSAKQATLDATFRTGSAVTIVGAGRAGAVLALALAGRRSQTDSAGHIVNLICRSAGRRRRLEPWTRLLTLRVCTEPIRVALAAPVVIFATADRDLDTAARQWADSFELTRTAASPPISSSTSTLPTWLHLSGAASPEVLRVGAAQRQALGSCHPLAAIGDALDRDFDPTTASPQEVDAFLRRVTRPLRGAFFALAGDTQAQQVGHALARSLGGSPHHVATAARAAYHGAASVVANDLVALLAIGEELCHSAQLPERAIRPALLHLAQTALDAVVRATTQPGAQLADGLTGAVGRGDAATLTQHLDALGHAPDSAEAHRRLSRVLLELVVSGGKLGLERAAAVRDALA